MRAAQSASPLRPEIAASWERSIASDLQPDRLEVPYRPEALAKKKSAGPAVAEKQLAPRQGNRGMPNQGVHRVESDSKASVASPDSLGPLEAPPEYREAYREFTRRLNEAERASEKR